MDKWAFVQAQCYFQTTVRHLCLIPTSICFVKDRVSRFMLQFIHLLNKSSSHCSTSDIRIYNFLVNYFNSFNNFGQIFFLLILMTQNSNIMIVVFLFH